MPRPAAAALLALAALLASTCAPVGDAWANSRTQRAAADQIMLVSKNPPTLGRDRLETQSKLYPDLATFLAARGWPDFLAESSNDGRHYLILYYLDRREAFACRTQRPDNRTMEFAGPYPITRHEFQMLSQLQAQFRDAAAAPPAGAEG